MPFRAIFERIEYRPENLDYVVTVVYTDDLKSKVPERYLTAAPSVAWLHGVVENRLAQLNAGATSYEVLKALEGTEIAAASPNEQTPEQQARAAYVMARMALQRAVETSALGIVAVDAKELSDLRWAAIALYQPAFISA